MLMIITANYCSSVSENWENNYTLEGEVWNKQEAELWQREGNIQKKWLGEKVDDLGCSVSFLCFSDELIFVGLRWRNYVPRTFVSVICKANFILVFNDLQSVKEPSRVFNSSGGARTGKQVFLTPGLVPVPLPGCCLLVEKLLCKWPLRFHRCMCWWNQRRPSLAFICIYCISFDYLVQKET